MGLGGGREDLAVNWQHQKNLSGNHLYLCVQEHSGSCARAGHHRPGEELGQQSQTGDAGEAPSPLSCCPQALRGATTPPEPLRAVGGCSSGLHFPCSTSTSRYGPFSCREGALPLEQGSCPGPGAARDGDGGERLLNH